MGLIEEIKELAFRFQEEDEAAGDLWSWLPSKEVTEKYHGDYYSEFCPPPAEVMKEASIFLGALQYPDTVNKETRDEWFGHCCCGDFCETKFVDFKKGSMVLALGPGVKDWLETWEGRQGNVVYTDGVDHLPTPDYLVPGWKLYAEYGSGVHTEAVKNNDIRILCFPNLMDELRLPSASLMQDADYAVFCPKDDERVFLKERYKRGEEDTVEVLNDPER